MEEENNNGFIELMIAIVSIVRTKVIRLLVTITVILLAMIGLDGLLVEYNIAPVIGNLLSVGIMGYLLFYTFELYSKQIIGVITSVIKFFENANKITKENREKRLQLAVEEEIKRRKEKKKGKKK